MHVFAWLALSMAKGVLHFISFLLLIDVRCPSPFCVDIVISFICVCVGLLQLPPPSPNIPPCLKIAMEVSSWMPRMLYNTVPSGGPSSRKNLIKCGLEYPSSALPMHWCSTACSWCTLISLPQPQTSWVCHYRQNMEEESKVTGKGNCFLINQKPVMLKHTWHIIPVPWSFVKATSDILYSSRGLHTVLESVTLK